MSIKYQFAQADGAPDWTVGKEQFDPVWDNARDRLRFHRGQKFTVEKRPDGAKHTVTLGEAKADLKTRLDQNDTDVKFIVRSLSDGFALAFRRHQTVEPGGIQVLTVARSLVATPYIFGVNDCSWLSKFTVNEVEPSIDLPHNAHLQHIDAITVEITKAQLLPGDLLFHHGDEHVSIYEGNELWADGSVWDTEPHDTQAPRGWPTAMLGTGVRRRPMTQNYYCDWQNVNGICRIVKVNGNP
jgi:hypothetical protein